VKRSENEQTKSDVRHVESGVMAIPRLVRMAGERAAADAPSADVAPILRAAAMAIATADVRQAALDYQRIQRVKGGPKTST
jgi:hypothetical protein